MAPSLAGSSPQLRLSVLIPVYNRARLLDRAARSVLSQVDDDFELVIVDDGSTDETPEVIAALSHDRRVRSMRHDRNRGVGAAWNSAIETATGDVVVLLGSDDELLPGALKAFRDAWDGAPPSVGLICFGIQDALSGRSLSGLNVPDGTVLAYEDLVCQTLVHGDHANSLRRAAFEGHRFPEINGYEGLVMWRIRRDWHTIVFSRPQIAVHLEGEDRLSRLASRMRSARDFARAGVSDLQENGPTLQRLCPTRYRRLCLSTSFYQGLAGQRLRAMRLAWAGMRTAGPTLEGLALLVLVLLGPRALQAAYAASRRGPA